VGSRLGNQRGHYCVKEKWIVTTREEVKKEHEKPDHDMGSAIGCH
jgi:hypothetical protein